MKYKSRYAHERCFNVATKTTAENKKNELVEKAEEKKKTGRKAKPKVELKDPMSEEEYQEKKKYYAYLRKLVNDEELSAKAYALTEDYIKRYNFKFEEMYMTLVYLNEILEKDLKGDVVGIIPYYYTEALNYYKDNERVAEINKDKDVSKMYKSKIIYINTKPKRKKEIDITSIGNGENG